MRGRIWSWSLLTLLLLVPWNLGATIIDQTHRHPHPHDSMPKVIIQLDHQAREIVIKAYIYPAYNDSLHHQTVKLISDYWTGQSDKYFYQLKHNKQKMAYTLRFDISVPKGFFNEYGMFIPVEPIPGRFLNKVEVVDKSLMPSLRGLDTSAFQIAGYAPPNFIYLASEFADNPVVAAHEMGHQLGMGHSTAGLMATDVNLLNENLSPLSIQQLFNNREFVSFLRYQFFEEAKMIVSEKKLKKGKIKRIK